jgi:hypothetical protein
MSLPYLAAAVLAWYPLFAVPSLDVANGVDQYM